jgi:hypothetical protein
MNTQPLRTPVFNISTVTRTIGLPAPPRFIGGVRVAYHFSFLCFVEFFVFVVFVVVLCAQRCQSLDDAFLIIPSPSVSSNA